MTKELLEQEISRAESLLPTRLGLGVTLLSRLLENAKLAANSNDSSEIVKYHQTLLYIQ